MSEVQTPSNPEVDTLEPEQIQADPNIVVDDGTPEEEQVEQEVVEAVEEQEVEKEPLNWYDNLPPDFRNDPDVTKYKSLEEYVKGNREVRKMIGRDKLVLPNDKSTPEDVDNFYKKLGRPDSPDDYKLPNLEMPDEIKTDESSLNAYKQKAHELGLNDKQFQELYAMQTEMTLNKYNQELEQAQKLKEKTETVLRQEFGDAYDSKIDNAQKVINTFFQGQELHPAFSVLSNDTGFVRAMSAIAEKMGEDVIAGSSRQTMTPKEAQNEWDSIVAGRHELSDAYFNELNPEHDAVVDKVLSLQKMAMAGGE